MPGRDIAALLQAEPTARALGAATGPTHQTDRREWLGQLIAAGDTVLSEGRAALWLHDAESGRLRLAFPECDAPPMAARDGLAAACLAGRSDLQVNDASAEAGFHASADRACGLRTRSLLSLPLVGHDGEALGVLQLLRPGIGPPPESDLRLMRALATQCQLAMHQVQLTDRLRENLRLEEEVEVAREIQFSTLPETMPAIPGYEVHGCFHPARHAGGDLFDLASYRDNAEAPLLSTADVRFYRGARCQGDSLPLDNPEFYPLVAPAFAGCPATIAISADVDPLRDECFAARPTPAAETAAQHTLAR